MDPLTAIGLLGTLCNVIDGANSLLRIAKSFKEGERDLFELCDDVGIFEEALKGFGRVLRGSQASHNISTTVINRALEEASITIQDLYDRLSTISESDVSTMRRMKWMQNRSLIRRLHERIKAQSTTLQSFLSLVHAETFLNLYNQYPPLPLDGGLPDNLYENHPTKSSGYDNPENTPFVSRTSLATSLDSSTCSSIDSFPSSTGSTSSSLQSTISNLSKQSSASSKSDGSTGPLIVRNACRFDCYCSCHPINEIERGSGLSLNKPFAHVKLTFVRCDDPSCESAKPVSKSVDSTASFTSSLFQKTFSHIMSSHSIKFRYNLSTFRTVPEGSEIMRYTKQGNLDSLKLAIQSGQATIWDTAPDGWSLLHTAAYNRQLPTVKYLLELGADTEVVDVGTRKPADLAILNSLMNGATPVEHEISKTFSQKDNYLSDFDFTPLHIAVLDMYEPNDHERPSLDQLLELLDDCNNAPPETNWSKWKTKYRARSPLFSATIEYFRASASSSPKPPKTIIDLINHPDARLHWPPLHWACSTGKTTHITTLLHHGADPYFLPPLSTTILHAAAESKTHSGLAATLAIWRPRAHKLDLNQRNHWGETPLHVAAWGSVQNVALLIDAGADSAARQEDGQVPLHCAGMTARGAARRQIIDLLCRAAGDNGEQINAQDRYGRSPLFEFLDDEGCVAQLVAYGARLDLLDAEGRSVFHHACIDGNVKVLKTLLQLSNEGGEEVMVTVKDHEGDTALNLALSMARNKKGGRECALVLLEGGDVGDMVGRDGWSAVHLAVKVGDADVLEKVMRHPRFRKGPRTVEGKTAEVVAMESGQWCGRVRELLRRGSVECEEISVQS